MNAPERQLTSEQCPSCHCIVSQSGCFLRCANCGWLGSMNTTSGSEKVAGVKDAERSTGSYTADNDRSNSVAAVGHSSASGSLTSNTVLDDALMCARVWREAKGRDLMTHELQTIALADEIERLIRDCSDMKRRHEAELSLKNDHLDSLESELADVRSAYIPENQAVPDEPAACQHCTGTRKLQSYNSNGDGRLIECPYCSAEPVAAPSKQHRDLAKEFIRLAPSTVAHELAIQLFAAWLDDRPAHETNELCHTCEDGECSVHPSTSPAETSAAPTKQIFVWLVEQQTPEGAVWFTPNMQVTKHASEAAWFVREQDAELFSWNISGESEAVEHGFIGVGTTVSEKAVLP